MKTYRNGNRIIKILPNGTKYRLMKPNAGEYVPEFSENIDVNISYNCNQGCKFCYISANNKGETITKESVQVFLKFVKTLPTGVELAINLNSGKESIKAFKTFVDIIQNRFIVNVTTRFDKTNLTILGEYQKKGLIHGIGVSLDSGKEVEQIKSLEKFNLKYINFHVINGINNILTILNVFSDKSILILGYKNVGKGLNCTPKLIDMWEVIFNKAKNNNHTLIFDNLCINQIQETGYTFNKEVIEKKYLGNDGQTSMYIDLVTLKVAKNSLIFNKNNYEFKEFKDIKEAFNKTKGDKR